MSDQPKKTVEEKLAERVKADIGELITNEELAEIIKGCIQDVFFKERVVPDGKGWGGSKKIPPLIQVTLADLMKESVTEATNVWIRENQEEVSRILDEVIREGIAKVVASVFDSKMHMPMMALRQEIVNKFGGM